jgi:hypothetical protein
MKGLSRCVQSLSRKGCYPRRSTSCAALAPSGAPTTSERGPRNMLVDYVVMKLVGRNVEARKLMTRMVMVRALKYPISCSPARERQAGQQDSNRNIFR